jgi:hypothetical protein
MRPSAPRSFLLVRHRDVSNVSGTGVVAEGTEWTDGSASLRWRGEHATTTFFETGLRSILAVHGHDGQTEIMFLDGSTPRRSAKVSTAGQHTEVGDLSPPVDYLVHTTLSQPTCHCNRGLGGASELTGELEELSDVPHS